MSKPVKDVPEFIKVAINKAIDNGNFEWTAKRGDLYDHQPTTI